MASNTEVWLCVRYISPSYCEIKRGLCHYFCSPYFFFWSHAFKLFLLELGDPNTCLSQIYCDCAKKTNKQDLYRFCCTTHNPIGKSLQLQVVCVQGKHVEISRDLEHPLKLLPSIIFPTLVFHSNPKKKKNPWSSERLKFFLHSDKIQEVRREER